MEMRDNTVLRADLYRPDGSQKHPAILMRTPYNKLLAGSSGFLNVVDATFTGYAVVIQDVRGRFASAGEYTYGDRFDVEGSDGYDSVEWIASQPWCDGNVAMAGASYLAVLQWVTAWENPPHLRAIAPWICRVGQVQEAPLFGGVAPIYNAVLFVTLMGLDIADKLEKQGKDVSQMRQMLYRATLHPEEVYNFLPLKDVPHFKFEGIEQIWQDWVMNAVPGPDQAEQIYWPYNEVKVPCFHVSGWYDTNVWATFHNFLNMQERGGSHLARQSQHVLIGPWTHGGQLLNVVGAINFGPSAGTPAARVAEQNLAFFNKYLRGIDIGLPSVRYFVMGRNRWQEATTWPLPETRWQRFFLHSKGHANSLAGDGLLSRDEPGSEPADIFVYNPSFPVPTTGGRILNGALLVPGPMDQSHIERRTDVLCYTTTELEEDTEVTGPLEFHLFASTSARDTDFTVKLVDVYPNGQTYNIAEGVIRARYRKSIFQPELVNPGEVNEYTIMMANTSQVFRKGHRIRIDISSSNFPIYDRNMNTGNPVGEDTHGIPAMQTIYHQPGYASYIDLPLIPSKPV